MITRRRFLELLGGLGGALAASPMGQVRAASVLDTGELYGGLLILPPGSTIPSTVQMPLVAMPAFCGSGSQEASGTTKAVTQLTATVEDAARTTRLPFYAPDLAAQGYTNSGCQLIYTDAGQLSGIIIGYNATQGAFVGLCGISLNVWFDYMRPYPVVLPEIVERSRQDFSYSKSDKLPAPGLILRDKRSLSALWIWNNVLHVLTVDLEIVDSGFADRLIGELRLVVA